MSNTIHAITLSAHAHSDVEATKAAEVMARALVGLGLDGIAATLSVLEVDLDE